MSDKEKIERLKKKGWISDSSYTELNDIRKRLEEEVAALKETVDEKSEANNHAVDRLDNDMLERLSLPFN